MRRTVLSKIQFSLLALGLVGGGIIACGDDPAPVMQTGNNNGDGDGDDKGDGDGDGDDEGDGDGDSEAECTAGKTKSCECDDGESKGKLSCNPVTMTWGTVCGGCPCEEGDTEICMCGTKVGDKTCDAAGKYGTCECDEAPPASVKCPSSTTCTMVPIGNITVCTEAGGLIPSPPGCTSNADCASKGFASTINCSANPLAAQAGGLLPAKVCLQTCSLGGTGGDAGTP